MPVVVPGPRLGSSVGLKEAGKKLRGHGRKSVFASLNITSMVDMLMIMVVFLLQTFSATGEILFISKNLVLPEAMNWRDIDRAPVVGISNDVVTLDGRAVADTESLRKDTGADFKIVDLHDQLVTLKNNYKLIHPNEDFPGTVILQSDMMVPFKVLSKVVGTCAQAGYGNINFAVVQRARHK